MLDGRLTGDAIRVAPRTAPGADDPALGRLVSLLADLFDCPCALVGLEGRGADWCAAQVGFAARDLPPDAPMFPSPGTEGPWATPDAAGDPRLAHHPLVAGAAGCRFLAGAPLVSRDGVALGVILVADRQPRPTPAPRQLGRLAGLAALAADLLAGRRAAGAPGDAPSLIVAQAAEALVHVGGDGLVAFASPASFAVAGVAPGDLVGRRALDLVDPRDRGKVLRHAARVARTAPGGPGAPLTFRVAGADPAAGRWLESVPSRAQGADGAATGWIHAIRDVTDRERRSAEAAAALNRSEAAVGARSDLLADVSHELRTALGGIMGFSQLLRRDGALGLDALSLVDGIEQAGRGLLAIVDDALDLSRLETGTVRLDARPFSMPRLIEDAVALVRPSAEAKGLALTVDLPPGPLADLSGDPDRLRQVLLNLLANAVKFTARGTVRVGLAASVPPGDSSADLLVTVADSGVGMAPDGIPNLFRRFTQADPSVSGRFGGTGLGLAITKALVDAMGGTIAVESAPGAGSRFTVGLTLPLAPDRRPAGPGPQPPERGALAGLAVLLAEDRPINQKLVVQMLMPLGPEVDVVGDGAAAVEAVGRRDYALVLMDMEMPHLDGVGATRRIRALGGGFADLPVVALTANAFPEQLDLCRDAGMDDRLVKPFSPEALAAVVLRWARRPGGSRDDT